MTATSSQSDLIPAKEKAAKTNATSAKPVGKQASSSRTLKQSMPTPKKPDIILKLIRRSNGARMQDLQKATGWQAHSIRAGLSGLRKNGIRINLTRTASGKTLYKAVEG
ncbi:DUF3489 domain-containing protein [Sneathiella chungangensis]|uniref:DUF3489 domain-containing protein n=1 Tax=Sneathiella chungangensis TaxID=1418234 RepID=A0A845MHD5_9PROT|nr:DUF3489 domain-containing protein [Sneathiella chungangensis]MZR22657.1 DUF3489 domain-containing protein [Sneathiella chungangensis]